MSVILIRLSELFSWCVGLSAVITGMSYVGAVPNTMQGNGIAMLCGMGIFVTSQVLALRGCFFVLGDRFDYFFANIAAYLIFAAVSMLVRPVFGKIIHTWVFCIFKFAMFSSADVSWVTSSFIAHGIMAATIVLAPLGMRCQKH